MAETKHVTIAYGKNGLALTVPSHYDVLHSRPAPGLADEAAAIRAALNSPVGCCALRGMVRPSDRVVVTHTDITRATPNNRLLPVILAELEAAGVPRDHITLLNALGTHRAQSNEELRAMLGDGIMDGGYHLVQHDAFAAEALWTLPAADGTGDFTTSAGHKVRVNRTLAEADVRYAYHGVMPGLCGFESVMDNHGAANIGHPRATWGVLKGNPLWEEMSETATRLTQVQAAPAPAQGSTGQLPKTFLVNVTINAARQMTGIFAGEPLAAHKMGVDFVRAHAMVPVDRPYDVVITTNSGYPLDQNLYQSVKGISAARKVVRRGGAIVMVTGCNDGLPSHGGYAAFLREAGSPAKVLEMIAQPGFHRHDQWTVQVQANVLQHCDVHIQSEGLTAEQHAAPRIALAIREALFIPVEPFAQGVQTPECLLALEQRYGPRVCIIPEGPESVGYLPEQ
ncbi:putative Nickel-dependent lactate racemase [Paratrimastix pyriformis]|uniref:Nickel-dependent lactate racemase n=1 Tax=Paratrimastix pyriformis TaxID=342808 RepID=A0ABQ8UAL0_9EUKA|nr:putative Nickel-dependent lactate racemase [Paratrimastix pyriformis]